MKWLMPVASPRQFHVGTSCPLGMAQQLQVQHPERHASAIPKVGLIFQDTFTKEFERRSALSDTDCGNLTHFSLDLVRFSPLCLAKLQLLPNALTV
jgi:hypothetical protein